VDVNANHALAAGRVDPFDTVFCASGDAQNTAFGSDIFTIFGGVILNKDCLSLRLLTIIVL